MKRNIFDAFPYLKPSDQAKPKLHTAMLMSPGEVDVAFKDESAYTRELMRGRWMLVGAVNQEMFTELMVDAGKDITGELGIVTTPAGAAYLILCSELKGRHHRHVLPLYEGKVKAFLRYASREPFRLFFESVRDGHDRMLFTSPLEPGLFAEARDVSLQMNLDKCADFIDELPLLIAHVAKIETMRRIRSQAIREVEVSILLPFEATEGRLPVVKVADHGGGANCH